MTQIPRSSYPVYTLLLLLAIAILPASMADAKPIHYTSRPGGYAPIPDLRADRIAGVASWAVQSLRSADTAASVNAAHYSFVSQLPTNDNELTIAVVQGSQQVVAGMNYQLTLVLSSTESQDDILGAFVVTVYDKFGSLSVTNWGREVPLSEAKSLLENASRFGEAETVEYEVPEEDLGARRV
jgi:hypothetical protein